MAEAGQLAPLRESQQAAPSGSSISSVLKKLRAGSSAKWDRDELLDIIFWMRIVLAFLIGCLWAVLPVVGLFGFTTWLMIMILVVSQIYRTVLGVDEDDYGGGKDFYTEGLMPSFTLFLLTWVLGYTALHAK